MKSIKSTKKAFTLVELIVVIVILAILGTIAFISLQGHSADARNTKRTSDLSQISSAITTENAQGTPLVSFVNYVTGSTLSGVALGWASATGLTTSEYVAGTPNYTALGVKEDDFKDPNEKPYVLAVTTKISGKYEAAASMEDGAGANIAKVVGTYSPRANNAYTTDNIESIDSTNSLIIITDSTANFFKKDDVISDGTNTWTITKVSNDGLTLTVSSTSGFTATWVLNLEYSESTGLIDDNTAWDDTQNDWTVLDNQSTYLPY